MELAFLSLRNKINKVPNMHIEISFSLKGPNGTFIHELDLEAEFDRFREEFKDVEDNLGRIMIDAGEDQYTSFEDELDYLVPEVCFRSIADLKNERPITIIFSRYSGRFTMSPSGKDVLITGDRISDLECPRLSLIEALWDCGNRFLSFYERFRGGMEDFDWRIREVQAARKAAGIGYGE